MTFDLFKSKKSGFSFLTNVPTLTHGLSEIVNRFTYFIILFYSFKNTLLQAKIIMQISLTTSWKKIIKNTVKFSKIS